MRYDHKFKCMECGLHFQAHSWERTWPAGRDVFCPECGSTGAKIAWTEKCDAQVFEAVPGAAVMVGFGRVAEVPTDEEMAEQREREDALLRSV